MARWTTAVGLAVLAAAGCGERREVWDVEAGVAACGVRGPRTGADRARELRDVHLTLRARGRVVFSGRVEAADCTRRGRSGSGLQEGDAIRVTLPSAPFAETEARWRTLLRAAGATPRDAGWLDRWAAEHSRKLRAGTTLSDHWMQGTATVRGTDAEQYTQSLPWDVDTRGHYASHFALYWTRPRP